MDRLNSVTCNLCNQSGLYILGCHSIQATGTAPFIKQICSEYPTFYKSGFGLKYLRRHPEIGLKKRSVISYQLPELWENIFQ